MFPLRWFTRRFFPRRYWPGDTAAALPQPLPSTGSLAAVARRGSMSAPRSHGAVRGAAAPGAFLARRIAGAAFSAGHRGSSSGGVSPALIPGLEGV